VHVNIVQDGEISSYSCTSSQTVHTIALSRANLQLQLFFFFFATTEKEENRRIHAIKSRNGWKKEEKNEKTENREKEVEE
jgi:hypothetical protein